METFIYVDDDKNNYSEILVDLHHLCYECDDWYFSDNKFTIYYLGSKLTIVMDKQELQNITKGIQFEEPCENNGYMITVCNYSLDYLFNKLLSKSELYEGFLLHEVIDEINKIRRKDEKDCSYITEHLSELVNSKLFFFDFLILYRSTINIVIR